MRTIAIEWEDGRQDGHVDVSKGKVKVMSVAKGKGKVAEERFTFASDGPARLEITIAGADLSQGLDATIVCVHTKTNPFSFFLRDVSAEHPTLIAEYGVVATERDDNRSYRQIEESIRSRGLQTKLQRIESEAEESYEAAAAHTRRLRCPTWLGLSRDIRVFEVSLDAVSHCIQPRFHGYPVGLPETDEKGVVYRVILGRGSACVEDIERRLEDGVLPILNGKIRDDEMTYNFTAFATLERTRLTSRSLRGTHFLVADGYADGHMFTEEQEKEFTALLPGEMDRDEETVLFFRAEAVNTASVPRYAWFRSAFPNAKSIFDGRNGFGLFGSERVFSVAKLNGKPLLKEEIAILIKPGEAATFELFIPHRPLSKERASKLARQDFKARHIECHEFWKHKIRSAAQVELPEKRVEEMVRAGLLHLDLIAYGLEPDGTIAPAVGIYGPIGSESSPIIQFFDSMGWHDVARRALTYFLDKQHEDGFIQNFGGYMLETGAALWSMGEHYRYTRDEAWVKQIAPKVIKSCEYIMERRRRNQKEELRGKGYGLLDGKVADPEDPYHVFMLNGYAYLGLSRAAEMLRESEPAQASKVASAAEELRKDIRSTFFEAMARSPVVPLGDGTWCPTVPPWAEARCPIVLLAEKGQWFTHGTFTARDSLLGPLYLILQEVIEPGEQAANCLVNYHAELMHTRNVALSQPYYSPHPYAHLRRGEVKAFLKAYYNGFSGLADRETYTFWEHYFHVSPHKTHEEAWFLMQTRWMLYLEQGEMLKLLPGMPRSWLEEGKCLELNEVATYFGPLSLRVESGLEQGHIRARVECVSDRKPRCVEVRLPHPEGRRAVRVSGGVYDASKETVRIEPFAGRAEVVVGF